MGTTLFILDGIRIGPAEILSAAGLALMIVLAVVLTRAFRRQGSDSARHAQRAADLEARLAEMVRVQADTAGRVHMMGETLSGRQAELARLVGERLDAVTHRIGQSMTESGRHTMESLRQLHERLAVIDHAQKNLTELTSQVTSLREVLAN